MEKKNKLLFFKILHSFQMIFIHLIYKWRTQTSFN